jgi:hypothetical protein
VSVHLGVTILIVGLLGAALLAVVVSRWALKMDRRARRKQQQAIRKRRRVGGVDGT